MYKEAPICGVYMIFCLRSGKCYVGSSKCIQWRWRCHKFALKRGNHYCSHLQRAWNKHGKNAFYLLTLELCAPGERLAREQFYLDAASSGDLYNTSRVAFFPEATPEVIAGRSERAKRQHAEGKLGRATWTEESEASFVKSSIGRVYASPSPESIEKMRKTKKEVEWNRPGRKERQAEIARELQARPSQKQHMRESQAAYWTPERRAEQAARAKAQGFGVRIP